MTETGWQAIGRIAKARRERLGLNQDELAQYGGPRVATVGKFERGAQASFPLRTQHQMEKSLGWSRGIVEQVVESIDEGELTAEDWEHDLVVEHVPDMDRPLVSNGDRTLGEGIDALRSVLRLIEPSRMDDAVRAALLAIMPHLTSEGAKQLGAGLREAFPPEGGDGDADSTELGGSAPKTLRSVDDLHVDTAAYHPEGDE